MKPISDTDHLVELNASALPENRILRQAFDLCVRKTHNNIKLLADKPGTWSNAVDGNYSHWPEDFFEIGNWTSSFFTGMTLIAWQQTEDEYFLNQALRLAPHYHEKVFTQHLNTHHDLGFLYSLYSVALYKLTGDKAHRETGLRAAEVLAQRFNPQGNFIRAWGHMNTMEQANMAIVDCLMNLPLLFWSTKETGDQKHHEIAVKHADMALKYFIRPDNSVNHGFRFDLKTGEPMGADNVCGYSVDSHWARGTTWAIYGFALAYGYTGHQRYLDASIRLARKFIAMLDSEVVPMWDFTLPKGVLQLRDASAASVAICAFQELAKLRAADAVIIKAKNSLLKRLGSEDYLNFDESCLGVQKHGQVGNAKSAYTSWGDYFLMEALARELYGFEAWW